jgi:prepilin-type N-terminal cleavage/methylation domain-containing protein
MKFLKQKNKNSGFTLVETLVAIVIFTSSIVVMMNVLGGGISNTTYAKNRTIATYLAQEGIETIRNMRDNYVLYPADTGLDWAQFVGKLNTAGCFSRAFRGCYFDDRDISTNITFSPCQSSTVCPLYNDVPGVYSYFGTKDSGFDRVITMRPTVMESPLNNGDEIKVVSTVYWKQGINTYNVSFSENLFNWGTVTPVVTP